MKIFCLALFLLFFSSCTDYYFYPTEGEQTDHLNKILRKFQNDYDFHDLYIDLKVSNAAHTSEPNVWGDVNIVEDGCHIEILSAQGFPENFPREEIEQMQEKIVFHEVLHLYLTKLEVPEDFQDKLIKYLQPHLKG